MTTVTERRIVREASESGEQVVGGAARGILKGGKMWRTSTETPTALPEPPSQAAANNSAADDNDNKPMVRFTEEELAERAASTGSSEQASEPGDKATTPPAAQPASAAPADAHSGEMTLQFRIGSSILQAGSLQRPNSAVRQLFPGQRFLSQGDGAEGDDEEVPLPLPYLLTADTLRTLDGTRRYRKSSDEEDGSLRRAIERNTLRRSLLRTSRDTLSRRGKQQRQDSLVERIRQLTCDVDDGPPEASPTEEPRPELEGTSDTSGDGERTSPQGEEQAAPAPLAAAAPLPLPAFVPPPPVSHAKTPSSCSTASSSSSSTSTYKKLSDLFARRSQDRAERPNQHQVSPAHPAQPRAAPHSQLYSFHSFRLAYYKYHALYAVTSEYNIVFYSSWQESSVNFSERRLAYLQS